MVDPMDIFAYDELSRQLGQPVSVAVAIQDIPAGMVLESPEEYLALMQAKVLPGGNTDLLDLRYPIQEEADLNRMWTGSPGSVREETALRRDPGRPGVPLPPPAHTG